MGIGKIVFTEKHPQGQSYVEKLYFRLNGSVAFC